VGLDFPVTTLITLFVLDWVTRRHEEDAKRAHLIKRFVG